MRIPLACATVLLLGLAGCSGDEPTPSGSEPPDASPSSPTPGATETALGSIEESFAMPLDPYRAVVGGLSSTDAEKVAAERSLESELIAECMREQGFEYFFSPTTAEDVLKELEQVKGSYPVWWDEQGTIAFAEQYGYGFVHHPENVAEEPEPEEEADPVALAETAYLESLSKSEREAWWTALLGDMNRDPSAEPNPDDWKNRGCYGWAYHEASGGKPHPDQNPAFAELVTAIYDATPTIDNDDDLEVLEAEWSACMAADGFSFSIRVDAVIAVEEELDDMWPRGADGKPEPGGEPNAEMKERFFADRERPAAIADATCAEAIDYDARSQAIAVAFEQRFIDEHRAELDALVLQYGQ